MPRIVPLQLLKCLKVLLDDYGGILSVAEVARIAGLMTKYSKKLVSKCIYVQILKCTKTELLDEFMRVGGWTLVHTWLNDSIRAMNWPLVQEILELLLLSPVDINRLKGNSAPKLVKGLCKDGGTEEVRILAKRLVDQWLKVVTENNAGTSVTSSATSMSQDSPSSTGGTSMSNTVDFGTASSAFGMGQQQQSQQQQQQQQQGSQKQKIIVTKPPVKVQGNRMELEKDPLADVCESTPEPIHYTLTPAQKKASQTGLVYKIIMKDGQQVLAKVAKAIKPAVQPVEEDDSMGVNEEEPDESEGIDNEEIDGTENESTIIEEDGDESRTSSKLQKDLASHDGKVKLNGEHRNSSSRKSCESNSSHASSKDKDRSKTSVKDKDHKSSKSSSSSSNSKSSSHKSSSSKGSSSSSSSKSKSSSSSSHHRSSSDKHRSDKDRSSKEHGSSSSSSKHRSSSSSKSSSSSSKERHRDKDKDKEKSSNSNSSSPSSSSATAASSLKKDKEREKEIQAEKDKDTLSKMVPPSLEKLGKIPKKPKPEVVEAQSITIPSKKASMSIEIRRDSEKNASVKTYKSQFRSHGLTEEAPPPPSRKGLKKPNVAPSNGAIIPKSLPSSLKRPSPPPRSSPTDKKAKIDINNVGVTNEKPGAIKLIAPKKIQTLVETNLFSDALSAATGPKKVAKRKRPTHAHAKDEPSTPSSPTASKVTPLKFYQDTLDQAKQDEKANKENQASGKEDGGDAAPARDVASKEEDKSTEDKEGVALDDDDDIPLKKVKEDIEQKVRKEQNEGDKEDDEPAGSDTEEKKESDQEENTTETVSKKPGPGCGPDGPPGVLMLHRRKGPKKKLTWRPQEHLEEVRYFELDETERVNVTKTSFMDMKNMERFSERETINLTRRGLIHEDCMEPQISWRPLIEVEDVPVHPDGSQSKQRKIQAEREMSTLRALYFSHAMIPDSPAEAEIEPVFGHDVPVIPLEDITGNPDAINDFTSMPWPEPKGSPKHGDNHTMAGSGGLGNPAADLFTNMPPNTVGGLPGALNAPNSNNNNSNVAGNPFNPFIAPFGGPNGVQPNLHQQQMQQMQMSQQGPWQGPPPNGVNIANPAIQLLGNAFNGPPPGSPNIDMGAPPMMGAMGQQFSGGQFGPQFGPPGFNGPNFRPMGPMGPMGPMMNGMMMGNPMMNGPGGQRNNGGNNNSNRNNNNWRNNNAGGGNGGINNWRSAGSGQNRSGGGGGGGGMNNNTGVCKAYLRGHCRLGKSCKYIHPAKSKRI